jgi:hypothetical protein
MKKLAGLTIIIIIGLLVPTAGWIAEELVLSGDRQQVEDQILKSTVRMVVQTWIVEQGDAGYVVEDAVGHATVMSG